MNAERSSPSDFTQEEARYAADGLLHDPPALAMPVPRLGYQPDFDFLLPLLPSTPFFAHPPQSSGELWSQYYSQPLQDHSGTVTCPSFDSLQPLTPCCTSALAMTGSSHHCAPPDSKLYPPPMEPQVTPGTHCDFFPHTIPVMAPDQDQASMAVNDFQYQMPAPGHHALQYDEQREPKNSNQFSLSTMTPFSSYVSLSHEGCTKRFTTSSNAKRHAKTHLL